MSISIPFAIPALLSTHLAGHVKAEKAAQDFEAVVLILVPCSNRCRRASPIQRESPPPAVITMLPWARRPWHPRCPRAGESGSPG